MKYLMLCLMMLSYSIASWAQEGDAVTGIDTGSAEVTLYQKASGTEVLSKQSIKMVTFPLAILESAPQRLKVAINQDQGWVDRIDVDYSRKVLVAAECDPREAKGRAVAATRGVGEPCNNKLPNQKPIKSKK